MRRLLADGFELDDDRARIDVDAVHSFISTQSYWGLGRERALVVQAIEGSTRVVGLYLEDDSHDSRQVGFARAVSDGTSVAYLADVYVLPVHRGRGLGLELVREMVERSFEGVRWLLHTADAQPLYAKLGFVEGDPPYPLMERPPTRGTAPATARR
ncbi:MAG TPA: GNAT family N-acetyltransferase [Solirubrobacteraceae bacterium]|nr:GNAT family N-acetyltransferase [Solirubrobacteraceae bacterium]